MTSANFLAAQWPQVSSGPSGRQDDQARAAWQIFIMAVLAEYMCAARRHQLDRSERSIHEEVLGDLILRCEGEARASKGEVAHYAKVPLRGR